MKVGDLARRTGLSVRTLHHYDDIGLLPPAGRTRSGHRLYDARQVRRLQQIASLRQVGLSLDEIAACLDRPDYSLERTLDLHIERISQEMDEQRRLRRLLEGLRDRVARAEEVTIDDLTRTIQATLRLERYFTPEQGRALEARGKEVGQERIREVEAEWNDLFAAFGDAMDRGLDPGSDEVRALARRSAALVAEFTGGDPGIRESLTRMYREEGGEAIMAEHGMAVRPGLWAYMGRARQALDADEGAP